jgi:vacuolar protein sorting-associated protein 33A
MALPKNSALLENLVDTESIKVDALKALLDIVDSVRGKKALILDPSLTGLLGLIVKFSILRDHGIEKVFHLDPTPPVVSHDKIIYLCRPEQRNVQAIIGAAFSVWRASNAH